MQSTFQDMTGRQYGHWTVLEKSHRAKNSGWYWKCQCACDRQYVIRGATLRNGASTQCRSCAQTARHARQTDITYHWSRRRRTNIVITWRGRTMILSDWSRALNASYRTLWRRLEASWTVRDTLTRNIDPALLDAIGPDEAEPRIHTGWDKIPDDQKPGADG